MQKTQFMRFPFIRPGLFFIIFIIRSIYQFIIGKQKEHVSARRQYIHHYDPMITLNKESLITFDYTS